MSRNFLLIYTGREGSSGIVNLLSQHPNVVVPLFEGLDPYNEDVSKEGFDVVRELDSIFDTGMFSGTPAKPGEIAYKSIDDVDPNQVSVGFKWRFWGNRDQVADVLKKHNVIVFFLFRRDFLELVSSIHLTQQLNSEQGNPVANWHPQFEFRTADKTKKDELRKKLESTTVRVAPKGFCVTMLRRSKEARRLRMFADFLNSRGVETSTLHYEEFQKDNLGFINTVLAQIDQPPLADAHSSFQKPTQKPAHERLTGLSLWKRTGVLPLFQSIYRSAVAKR